ncbi:hypothetical protein TNCT_147331 [Trichonephila clavata]|uniref:Uncharacterized protein n=1 Tax=Trichonephila clavata TaxID=2740835 RepID=A0A8X6F353_TRICU|nr:hypothetical protein TNCT_147331 [Trichonephila clavata]
MVTGKQSGKSIKQRNQTQRYKRLFKREENKDEKKSRRKTLVKIELPGRTTESATPGKSKKVILHIPDAKSKQPREFFCKISDPKNEIKMNDKIATESNTKNTPADINTLTTSNRRNHRNKRRQNFERQKVSV